MAEQNPPGFLQARTDHPSERLRREMAADIRTSGVAGYTDLSVAASGTPNMHVLVNTGRAYILGTENAYQGAYFVDNQGQVDLTISAAHASLARKDLIVARVYDAAYSGASNTWALEVVTGTPSASPVDPATPANSLVLARIDVPAAASSITGARITDLRTKSGEWARPWGMISKQVISADSGGFTTAYGDINQGAFTFTATSGRQYRYTLFLPRVQIGASFAEVTIYLTDSAGTGKGDGRKWCWAASTTEITAVKHEVLETGISGSISRKFRTSCTAGSHYIYATGDNAGYVLVEDIGPA